jgi:hypothetical protein
MTYHRSSLRLLLLALAAPAGCGLISSDVAKLTFDLPPKTYHYATPSGTPSGNVPPIPCTSNPDCCMSPIDCNTTPLTCDGANCQLQLTVTMSNMIDLATEVPKLQTLSNQALVDVTVSGITYMIANTMDVALPAITIYLAPMGITDPTSSQAVRFGTIPATPARFTGPGNVMLDAGGQQAFAMYAHDFRTPFNFIATTTVVVPAGSPFPNGTVDVTINGHIQAQPSL